MTRRGGTPLDVRVLGRIEAGPADRPFALGGPTQLRVFAALIARRGEVIDVSALEDVCWPDGDAPDRASHNIRTYVHRLRGALRDDGERIETVGTGYRLGVERTEVDLDLLADHTATAERAMTTADAVTALDASAAAVGLWRGRPFGEFADEPWALAEGAHASELYARVREVHADALLTLGRPDDAIGTLEPLVTDEPLRERPRALLMRAFYEAGRQPEALRAFQDFRRLLIDEVGVEPSPDLVDLDRRIATRALDAAAAEHPTVGSYQLHERIGEGAFAVVHRATQGSLGREVAIKVVRAELANQPEFIRRFEAEAQIVAAIEHPNVVPLYDYWREPGQAFLVMRWMIGGSLEQRLDAGPLPVAATLDIVDQIAAALDAAHAHQVVHRDVKPANIMFDDVGRAFLGDFGIALAAEERATPEAALSEGSPVFASPEQLRREPAGPEADVHALGIVAFTALTGRTPFHDAADEAELLRRQLGEPIPAASASRPDLPAGIDEVISVAAAKRAADRFPTAGAFAAALRSAALGTSPIARTTGAAHGPRANPYRGLRAFDEADANRFFGRTRLVGELLDACADPDRRLVSVVGASGSGKSSVVRAGLIPALRDDAIDDSASWFVTTMLPGAHPFEALETALLRVATNPPAALLDQLRDGDRGIHRAMQRIVPDDTSDVLVVIDQFEELFTTTAPDVTERFLRALAVAATEPGGSLRVVTTMRADFYDRPLRHPEFAPLFTDSTVAITPLAPDELETAITAPAAAVGVGFEPGLVAEIIADVNSQPGALPLLQFALMQTFDTVHPGEGGGGSGSEDSATMTVDAYRSIGGLTGALANRAESLYAEADHEEQTAIRALMQRLVTLGEGTEDTRRRALRSELASNTASGDTTGPVIDRAIDRAVERYGSARLLTFDRDPATREPTVEIAHEALIREWPRLRTWLDDDRDTLRTHHHLARAARSWTASGHDPSELYRGTRLATAEPLLSTPTATLNPDEHAFLDTSIRQREAETAAEEHRARRLRRLITATAIVAALMLVAGVAALWQWNRADDQAALADRRAAAAETAERQADLERIRAVALNAAGSSPPVAALLAVEAYRLDPSLESLDVLQRVLSETPGYHGLAAGGPYLDAVALGDATLVAASADALDIWDLRTRSLARSIAHTAPSGSSDLAAVGDGRVAALDTDRASTTVYSIETGIVTASIDHPTAANDIDVSPDGTRLAAALAGGATGIWSTDDGTLIATLDTGATDVSFVRWHPRLDQVATVTSSAGTQLWDVGAGQLLWANVEDEFAIINQVNPFAASFSPSGERFAYVAGSLDGGLVIVDTSDGTILSGPTGIPGLDGFPIDDLAWQGEQKVIVAGELNLVGTDLESNVTDTLIDQFVVPSRSVQYSPSIDKWVSAGPDGLEFWADDASGPLARVIELPPDQGASLARSGGPLLTSLAADGSRLLTSVFELPAPVPVYAHALDEQQPTPTEAPGLGIVIGFGEFTLAGTDFHMTLLDHELQPMGAPVPLPPDFSELSVDDGGNYLAFGRLGGRADVYRSTGEFIGTVEIGAPDEFPGAQTVPRFTSDGEYMVVATTDGRSGLWRSDSLERIALPERIASTRLYAMGPWMYAADGSGAVQRIDPATLDDVGQPIPLTGTDSLLYPDYDPTHQRIASTSGVGVTVFDLETGTQLGRELRHIGGSSRVEFSGDGTILSVALPEGAIALWNFDTEAWSEIACRVAGRNLTRAEWDQLGPRTVDYRATCDQHPTGE